MRYLYKNLNAVVFLLGVCLTFGVQSEPIVVDTGKVLREHEENPLGINLNYIRDHDDNRADGAIPIEQAIREMGVRWLRYPGGEKSDWHFSHRHPTRKRTR